MAVFSRALRRQSPVRIAAAVLGLAWLAVLAAYAYFAATATPTAGGVVSAAAAFLIAGSAILYAWREPGR